MTLHPKPQPKVKLKSISFYKKKADRVFSEWVRRRYADQDGIVVCFICGREMHWKSAQNGHFLSRSYNATRYDEVNCNTCCVGCNVFKHGNMVEYAARMRKKYGTNIIEKLLKRGKETKQFTRNELQEIIKVYSEKIQNLENDFDTNV